MTGKAPVRIVMIEGPECVGKSSIFRALRRRVSDPTLDFIHELPSYVGRRFPLGTGATLESEVALLTMNGVLMEKFRQVLECGHRAISDRCWISQTVYARVRQRLLSRYAFDAGLFVHQENVLFALYSDILRNGAIVYVDVPPAVSLVRLERRKGKSRINHNPDLRWTQAACEEYRRYFETLETNRRIQFQRINGMGSRQVVLGRFVKACSELGFCLSICDS